MQKPVVLLDPGHGGFDPGACYNGLEEKELNLALALKVAGQLKGFKVLLTRESDIYVSLADRVALSRRAEPDLFLSLHANAGGGRGFESFIYNELDAGDPAAVMQKVLHEAIMGALACFEIVDRGRKKAAFYVLKNNPRPAVLIESLFIDNAREAEYWRNSSFVEALAKGVTFGIRTALGAESQFTGPEQQLPGEEKKSQYTVQVGSFHYLENARQRLAEAQQAGFSDAFIYQKR